MSLSSLKSYFSYDQNAYQAPNFSTYDGNDLSDYRRGILVPNVSDNSSVPSTSSGIDFSNFRGKYRAVTKYANFYATYETTSPVAQIGYIWASGSKPSWTTSSGQTMYLDWILSGSSFSNRPNIQISSSSSFNAQDPKCFWAIQAPGWYGSSNSWTTVNTVSSGTGTTRIYASPNSYVFTKNAQYVVHITYVN